MGLQAGAQVTLKELHWKVCTQHRSPMTKSFLHYVLLSPRRGHSQLGQNCIWLVGRWGWTLQWGSHKPPCSSDGKAVVNKLSCGDLLQTVSAELMKMVAVWPKELSCITPSVHPSYISVHKFVYFLCFRLWKVFCNPENPVSWRIEKSILVVGVLLYFLLFWLSVELSVL